MKFRNDISGITPFRADFGTDENGAGKAAGSAFKKLKKAANPKRLTAF